MPTNNYYEFTDTFIPGQKARSTDIDREYLAIQSAFDLLPTTPSAIPGGRTTFAGLTAGSGNAFTVSMPNTRTAYTDGDEVVFVADRANTGAATLNVDGVGAVNLRRFDGSALTADDIASGLIYVAKYDAANTRFLLQAPTPSFLTDAAASAAAAAASAAAALASQTAAASSESLAQEWAENAEDVAVTGYPGQFSALHWAAKAQASAITGVITGDILTATPPTTEAITALLSYEDADNSDQLGYVGYSGSQTLYIQNRMHGGSVVLRGEDAGGVLRSILYGDPDASVFLYQAGSQVAQTHTSGIHVGDASGSAPYIGFYESTFTTRLGYVQFANTGVRVQGEAHGQNFGLYAEDALGVSQPLFFANPDSSATIYYDGASRIVTDPDGIQVHGTSSAGIGTAQDSEIALYDAAAANLIARIGFFSTGALHFRNTNHGGDVNIQGENGAGVLQNFVTCVPDGAVAAYYSGTRRAATQSTGIFGVYSDGNTSTEVRRIDLMYADGTLAALLGHSGSADLQLRNTIDSGHVLLRGDNAASSVTTMLEADPDADVSLYYAGSRSLATTSVGADIYDNSGNNVQLIMRASDSTALGSLVFQAGGGTLKNFVHGAPFNIVAEDAGGTERTILDADPDGVTRLRGDTNVQLQAAAGELAVVGVANAEVNIYYDNVIKLATDLYGIEVSGSVYLDEQSAAQPDTAAQGQIWVRNGTPNELWFTNDAGGDWPIATAVASRAATNASYNTNTAGNEAYNKIAVYTDANAYTITLENNTSEVRWPVGASMQVVSRGTGTITISEGTSTTLYHIAADGTVTDTAGGCTMTSGVATIYRESASVYLIWGANITP